MIQGLTPEEFDFHYALVQRGKGAKNWANSWSEVEYLGKDEQGRDHFGIKIGDHRVFKDKESGEWKRHKLTDKRSTEDYVLIQSAKCCVEVYPYYAKYFDVHHEEVRLYEERWVVQRLFKAPDTWRDVDAWNPVTEIEETESSLTVTITYDTDYGSLVLKYIQRDSSALKHDVTFINTSGSAETFRVLQKWAGIVGDQCNNKDLPLAIERPSLIFHKRDELRTGFMIAENLWNMMFNDDGSEKTEECLQTPVSIEVHAQGMKADFIYGNWALAEGETLEVDPDTTTIYPHVDGFIKYKNGAFFAADSAGTSAEIGRQRDGAGNNYLSRTFLSFDTSPILGTVNSVTLYFWCAYDYSTLAEFNHFVYYGADQIGATLGSEDWNKCTTLASTDVGEDSDHNDAASDGGSLARTDDADFGTGEYFHLLLAVTSINISGDSDYRIKSGVESNLGSEGSARTLWRTSEWGGTDRDPYLYVDYTLPIDPPTVTTQDATGVQIE